MTEKLMPLRWHGLCPCHRAVAARTGCGCLAGRLLDDPDLRAPGRPGGGRMASAACPQPLRRPRRQPRDLPWPDFVSDAALRELIRLALANNRDLRVAVLNIEQARAQLADSPCRPVPHAEPGRHRHRAAQDRRQRRHQQRLHRRPVGHRLGDRFFRPRGQPEGRGAGAVPGHRRGALGRADQPDRGGGQRLAEPADQRRAAGADAAHPGHARGLAAPDEAAPGQWRRLGAGPAAGRVPDGRGARRAGSSSNACARWT